MSDDRTLKCARIVSCGYVIVSVVMVIVLFIVPSDQRQIIAWIWLGTLVSFCIYAYLNTIVSSGSTYHSIVSMGEEVCWLLITLHNMAHDDIEIDDDAELLTTYNTVIDNNEEDQRSSH